MEQWEKYVQATIDLLDEGKDFQPMKVEIASVECSKCKYTVREVEIMISKLCGIPCHCGGTFIKHSPEWRKEKEDSIRDDFEQ